MELTFNAIFSKDGARSLLTPGNSLKLSRDSSASPMDLSASSKDLQAFPKESMTSSRSLLMYSDVVHNNVRDDIWLTQYQSEDLYLLSLDKMSSYPRPPYALGVTSIAFSLH